MKKVGLLVIAVVSFLVGCGDSPRTATPAPTGATPGAGEAAATGGNPEGWQEYSPADGGYSVLMPGKPEEQSLEVEGSADPVGYVAQVEVGDMKYMVLRVNLPDESAQLGEEEWFSQYIESVKANVEGQSGVTLADPEVKTITLDGHPGREFTIGAEGQGSRNRVYRVDKRSYTLTVGGPLEKAQSEDATRFLDSFKLKK